MITAVWLIIIDDDVLLLNVDTFENLVLLLKSRPKKTRFAIFESCLYMRFLHMLHNWNSIAGSLIFVSHFCLKTLYIGLYFRFPGEILIIRGVFEKYVAWHHNSTMRWWNDIKVYIFGNRSTSTTGWFVYRLNSTWHARAAHAQNG